MTSTLEEEVDNFERCTQVVTYTPNPGLIFNRDPTTNNIINSYNHHIGQQSPYQTLSPNAPNNPQTQVPANQQNQINTHTGGISLPSPTIQSTSPFSPQTLINNTPPLMTNPPLPQQQQRYILRPIHHHHHHQQQSSILQQLPQQPQAQQQQFQYIPPCQLTNQMQQQTQQFLTQNISQPTRSYSNHRPNGYVAQQKQQTSQQHQHAFYGPQNQHQPRPNLQNQHQPIQQVHSNHNNLTSIAHQNQQHLDHDLRNVQVPQLHLPIQTTPQIIRQQQSPLPTTNVQPQQNFSHLQNNYQINQQQQQQMPQLHRYNQNNIANQAPISNQSAPSLPNVRNALRQNIIRNQTQPTRTSNNNQLTDNNITNQCRVDNINISNSINGVNNNVITTTNNNNNNCSSICTINNNQPLQNQTFQSYNLADMLSTTPASNEPTPVSVSSTTIQNNAPKFADFGVQVQMDTETANKACQVDHKVEMVHKMLNATVTLCNKRTQTDPELIPAKSREKPILVDRGCSPIIFHEINELDDDDAKSSLKKREEEKNQITTLVRRKVTAKRKDREEIKEKKKPVIVVVNSSSKDDSDSEIDVIE